MHPKRWLSAVLFVTGLLCWSHTVLSAGAVPATGPLRVNPSNPRYFTDGSSRAILLSGSHTWSNFQDAGLVNPPPVFDYTAYLDFLETNGHNFFRLWNWEQTRWIPSLAGEFRVNPSPYLRQGSGTALDGGPKFDLTRFNQAYFDRMRTRIIQAGEHGIYASIMLFNGFSIDDKTTGPGNAWPGHPFNSQNNINGIDGDLNHNGKGEETHTLQSSSITALQEAFVRKVIDTVNDLDNVLYEISNESPSNSQDWQYHMINYVKSYEASMPKQHPVGMTVEYPGGDNAELSASPADWISPNESGGYKDNPPAADGSKVIVSDTDHLWGIGGDRVWVWKSFTRGLNPLFMDCYDGSACPGWDPNSSTRLSLLSNIGYTRIYANRMNLAAMTPHGNLTSTSFALANPVTPTGEYLVYFPDGGIQTVNLSATPGTFAVEWLNPANGETTSATVVTGGASRLFTPPFTGDAVLYLYQVSEDSTPGLESLSLNPASVVGGRRSQGVVTLTGSAPAGGVQVSLSDNSSVVSVPASVTIPQGNTSTTFEITTTSISTATSATISAVYGGVTRTASLTITPPPTVSLHSLSLNPTSVVGGNSSQGVLTLTSSAPAGGVRVSLSDNSSVVSVPASVTIPQGSTNTTFAITTASVTTTASATISAVYGGATRTASLAITPPAARLSSLSLNPTSMAGGNSSQGVVTLTSSAPAGGIRVNLSDNSWYASVPSSVTIPQGSTSTTFAITTKSVTTTASATISAVYSGATRTASLTITPPPTVSLHSLSLNPTSMAGGNSSQAVVTLTSSAPAGGVQVSLSDNSSVVSVPASVTIPQGSTSATFNISTVRVWGNGTTATISATYRGTTKSAQLTLRR